MKTPPPPIWGTELEEDNYDKDEEFYNHQKAIDQIEERKRKQLAKIEAEGGPRTLSQRAKVLKLKRKVVYTYEYSDPSDDEKQKTKEVATSLPSKEAQPATTVTKGNLESKKPPMIPMLQKPQSKAFQRVISRQM